MEPGTGKSLCLVIEDKESLILSANLKTDSHDGGGWSVEASVSATRLVMSIFQFNVPYIAPPAAPRNPVRCARLVDVPTEQFHPVG